MSSACFHARPFRARSNGALNGSNGACRAAIERAQGDVRHARVPQSWLPMDLDPENVLVDDDGAVRFIDLDDSYLGPAPLAIATFARRIRRARIAAVDEATLKNAVYRAYEQGWPVASLVDCRWRSVEIASTVLDAYLGWRRIVTGTERGEVCGALEHAATRIGRELATAVNRVSQSTTEGGDKP